MTKIQIQAREQARSQFSDPETQDVELGNQNFLRKSARALYLQQERQVLKDQLDGNNNVQPIYTDILPDIMYPTDVITWRSQKLTPKLLEDK